MLFIVYLSFEYPRDYFLIAFGKGAWASNAAKTAFVPPQNANRQIYYSTSFDFPPLFLAAEKLTRIKIDIFMYLLSKYIKANYKNNFQC